MRKKITKKLSDFMRDESGAMSKKNILKLSIGTLSVLGVLSPFISEVVAGSGHMNSANHVSQADLTHSSGSTCKQLSPTHLNQHLHCSYGSY